MKVEDKIKEIKAISEEIIGFDELTADLAKNEKLIAYDGFEPSGKIHIAQGLMRVLIINKLIEVGIDFKILIADWLAYANNKLGGDLEKIKITGEYYKHVWKACGLNDSKVEFLWTSNLVKDDDYWFLVMKIAKNTTLKRIIRCSQVMGRSETGNLSAAQILYPAMQAADIFYIKANIAQMGLDQRKVNMLTRQIADEIGYKKPIAIHHHMIMSLLPPEKDGPKDKIERSIKMKMSKSKPDSAIFMSDSPEEIKTKILKAYCPTKIVVDNPIMEYFKYIVFCGFEKVEIKRENKFGGDVTYLNYESFQTDYENGSLFPLDVKINLVRYLNQMLQPVRDYFINNQEARSLQEQVESFTRKA
ncbi:tyrosine--tRNA ligase [Patescibacteria group bacterium]|nr:tyrosine--tRNA ligase [Patescibacteria group bacterium]